MKIRILIYLVTLFFGIIIFSLYIFGDQIQKIIPSHCNQYSGNESYAWGGDAKKCKDAGCKVLPTEITPPMTNTFDTGGYKFKCVPFLFENN